MTALAILFVGWKICQAIEEAAERIATALEAEGDE